jgi:nucleoside-diphosphate kinase
MLKVGLNQSVATMQNKSMEQKSQKAISFTAWERTLIAIKEDAFTAGKASKIKNEFKALSGLKLMKQKTQVWSRETMEKHYDNIKDKPYFKEVINYVTSGNFKVMIFEGEDAVSKGRNAAMEIRDKYKFQPNKNVIHSSDSVENAMKEEANFFNN